MGKPRLLLVDELSFGLSPMLADRLFSTLSKINEEGTRSSWWNKTSSRPCATRTART
jgi:ABC-type branched-subunit amino acid transport system ATPase component